MPDSSIAHYTNSSHIVSLIINISIFYFVECHSTIDLADRDANSLESLIKFAYTGQMSILPHTLDNLKSTADFLAIDSISNALSDTAPDPCSNITETSSKILADLNRQWQQDKYVNLVIIVGCHRIAAHKCVLSAFSQYFNGLLNPNMKEGKFVL